jgi:hypothetical protein
VTLLPSVLPEYLGNLAAAVTVTLASWETRKRRARRTRRPNQDTGQLRTPPLSRPWHPRCRGPSTAPAWGDVAELAREAAFMGSRQIGSVSLAVVGAGRCSVTVRGGPNAWSPLQASGRCCFETAGG